MLVASTFVHTCMYMYIADSRDSLLGIRVQS